MRKLKTGRFIGSYRSNWLSTDIQQYGEENHRFLQLWGFRQIFVYRDFRDIVVSYAHFVINTFMNIYRVTGMDTAVRREYLIR